MGLFDMFKPKEKERYRNAHEFTDSDRESSTETWRLKQELKHAEMRLESERKQLNLKADILEAKNRYRDLIDDNTEETEEESQSPIDAALMAIAMKVLQPKESQSPMSAPVDSQEQQIPLSTQELEQIWGTLPAAYQKAARKMKDAELEKYIRLQKPQATATDIAAAIDFVRHN